MFLVFFLYILLASTFTLVKAVLDYVNPILFVGIRMTISGTLLLGYQYFFNNKNWRLEKKDWPLFVQIIVFHIFFSYILEILGLQWVTAAKACLLYNLTPFITALFSYFLISHRLTLKQIMGLAIGFAGFLPVLMASAPLEEVTKRFAFLSLPELSVIIAVISGSYGWLVMRKLITDQKYSPIMINGVGMLGGGILAFVTSVIWEGWPIIKPMVVPVQTTGLSAYLLGMTGPVGASIIMLSIYTFLLIIIANVIFYNLYGMLLVQYSPTLLSFAGMTTPLFAALFGWLLLNETITWHFFLTTVIVTFGLYLFYQDEW